jgi:hypothetical protein
MSVSLSSLGGAGWQFFTDDGVPLSGGLLFTYLAGTTTPAVTYTSLSGTIANSNPLVLDAAGRPPSQIWLTDGVLYKFVVKDALNVEIRTYDNIPGIADSSALDALSASTGSSLIGYIQGSAGSVAQTVQSRLRNDFVVPEDFGAVGDGIANDTAALQAALVSGKDVNLTAGKTYLHTSELVISANNQRVIGSGAIRTSGAVNSFRITANGVELSATFNSPGQTAGYAIYAANANRCKIHKANIISGFGALYVEQTNTFVVDWMWGALRGPGVKWFGSDAKRSDVLTLNFVLLDPGDTEYGLDWDGNCHSLEVKYLGIVGGRGAIIRNTSGGSTYPAIGRIGHIEIDYSVTHGIEIQAGLDYDFVMPYVLGSAGDGFRIGATINDSEVRITGGKSIGNTGYGINALGGVVQMSGSVAVNTNTAGNYNGNVWCLAPRLAVDNNFYQQIVSSNPLISFDQTDFISYSRSQNIYNFQIGGAGVFSMRTAYSQSFAPVVFPVYTVATLPTGVTGMRAFVNDSSVASFGSAVSGGGSSFVPVFFGSSWIVG